MTNRTLTILLAVTAAAVLWQSAAAGGRLACRRVSAADGLPSNNINCIAQDADGYIWFGTTNGLSRFDGYSAVNFTSLSPDGGAPTDRRIGSISIEGQTMTVTTSNSARAIYDLGRARFTAYTPAPAAPRRPGARGAGAALARKPFGGGTLTVTPGGVSLAGAAGRTVRTYRLPAALGTLDRVEVCFVWGRRLAIMTGSETFVLDPASGTFSKPPEAQISRPVHQGTTPGCDYVSDGSGRLWMFFADGTLRRLHLLKGAAFAQVRRHQFYPADNGRGRVFIATYGGGLFVYDKLTGAVSRHSAADSRQLIHSDFLTCAMADRDGNVWIGSEAAGAVCLSETAGPPGRYLLPKPADGSETANHVYAIEAGADGGLTVCTRENEIIRLDTRGHHAPQSAWRLPAPAFAMMTDSRGRRWTATRGAGLFVGARRYHTGDGGRPLPSDNIYALAEGPRDHFWIATWGGGLLSARLDSLGRLTWRTLLSGSANERRVRCLALADDGTLWAGTDNGLYAITNGATACYNLQNRRLHGNEVITLLYSRRSGLWAGVHGHGLAQCSVSGGRLEAVRYYDAAHGLAGNIVNSIAEDDDGNIWAATEEGISRVCPATRSVATFNFATTLMGNVFSENSAAKTADGRLFFGTRQGVLEIRPGGAPPGRDPARCVLTDLAVNGTSVLAMDSTRSPLAASLTKTGAISLGHAESSLTLHFSDLDYSTPHATLYQFMLEGADGGWRGPTSLNRADYGNLSPGRYTFRLRQYTPGADAPETTLQITIRRPWYSTWQAWLLYLAAAAAAAFALWRNRLARSRLRRRMEIERSLNEFRLNFFTHIAHEFRTPLAIIKGAVDKISRAGAAPAPRQAVALAARGTQRLTRLVDRLMEFRKVSAGSMRLSVERGDIVQTVRRAADDFRPMARQKDITLTFTPAERSLMMLQDRHVVESIVCNLLSNAIKYTPQKGRVSLTTAIADGGATLVITVSDTGPGIAPRQRDHLFEPFMHGYVSQGGMGIGLFLAHRMAGLHHGSLEYSEAGGGSGSVFTLRLPTADDAYAGDWQPHAAATGRPTTAETAAAPTAEPAAPMNDVRIAVVEDDPDMMEQLRTELGAYFRVDAYMDGDSAVRGITAEPPALAVCDVMLPGISGYEVVARLRAAEATRRLPVIMLTALDDDGHQIKAYNAGADDYMVKPCNLRVLLARAARLIRWSGGDGSRTDGGGKPDGDAPQVLTSQADRRFREAADAIISRRLADKTLTADTLAEAMHVGRTKLFGWMKELTGMTPARYIMKARMETAARLLAEGTLNVSEVGMRVGMDDPSYFYRCFKSHYGVAPSKYGKSGGEG